MLWQAETNDLSRIWCLQLQSCLVVSFASNAAVRRHECQGLVANLSLQGVRAWVLIHCTADIHACCALMHCSCSWHQQKIQCCQGEPARWMAASSFWITHMRLWFQQVALPVCKQALSWDMWCCKSQHASCQRPGCTALLSHHSCQQPCGIFHGRCLTSISCAYDLQSSLCLSMSNCA